MASIRKREWGGPGQEKKTAWVVDYKDQAGKRRLKSFERKKDAEAWWNGHASYEVAQGIHTADSASVTVKRAGEIWLDACRTAGLERSTLAQYEQHLGLHIRPFLGDEKLSKLTPAAVRDFEAKLRDSGRSVAMVKKVISSLGALIAEAQEASLVNRNVVRELRRTRRTRGKAKVEKRRKTKLRVGVDIPTRDEIRSIVGKLTGVYRPIILVAIFAGLRASELRGLRWEDVDFKRNVLHVRQRADRFNVIGRPKSEAGERDVPMTPLIASTLKEWKLQCPKRDTGQRDADDRPVKVLDLVFPNGSGRIESLANIWNRGLAPVQIAAGVTVDTGEKDAEGKPIIKAKYSLHKLRHFYASWCINSQADGGLGLPPKRVQERMGHSTLAMTMDTYGHLFPANDDHEELAAAESALLA